MQTVRHFRFSITSLLVFTAVVALGMAFWQSGETTRIILKLLFHGLIAIGAWQDCREYNRVQSPFDSAGFRWFYRIARTSSIVAFLLHAIKIFYASQLFDHDPSNEWLTHVFNFSPDFLILFTAIAGAMPLSETYIREKGSVWQRTIGVLGGLLSAALILYTTYDWVVICSLVLVAIFGIVWGKRQPVLTPDDPLQFSAAINNFIGNSSVIPDTAIAVLGAIGVTTLVLSPKGSFRTKLGLIVATLCVVPVALGLIRYWDDSAFFRCDLRPIDAGTISSSIPVFGFGDNA